MKTLRNLIFIFGWFYPSHYVTSFASIDQHSFFYTLFSSNVDVISSNLFVSGELNAHRADSLTHSMGTDRHGELLNNLK